MTRRNKRQNLSHRRINIAGVIYESDVTGDSNGQRAHDRYLYREADLDKYGTPPVRATYLEAGVGRAVTAACIEDIVRRLEITHMVSRIITAGLVYVPGTELAQCIRYGLVHPAKPRLSPEQSIEQLTEALHQAGAVTASARRPVPVELQSVYTKKWGNHTLKLMASVKDQPSPDYPCGTLLLGEKTATVQKLGGNIPNQTHEPSSITHALAIATAALDEKPWIEATLHSVAISTEVCFEPMGFVRSPLPRN